MRRAWQLVRYGFELGGAVSLVLSVGAASAVGAVVGFVADFPLGLRVLLIVSAMCVVAAAVLALTGWIRTRPQAARGAPSAEGGDRVPRGGGVHAGRNIKADGPIAGRDVVMQASQGPTRGERLRWVRLEIKQIMRRLDQLDWRADPDNPDGWNTIWPDKKNPYAPLPIVEWQRHGGALDLPAIEWDAVDRAYDLAEQFNEGRLAALAQETSGSGPGEPNLSALRLAFVRADTALAARRTDES